MALVFLYTIHFTASVFPIENELAPSHTHFSVLNLRDFLNHSKVMHTNLGIDITGFVHIIFLVVPSQNDPQLAYH